MNLASVFRALALGFEQAAAAAEVEATSDSAAPVKGKKAAKSAAAPDPALPAATPPPVATAPAPQPAPSPAAPPLSKDKLNKAVLAVAGVDRDAAIALLAKFGVSNTATLPVEKYQAVFDAFEEAKAKIDAASVTASLV